MAVSADNRYEWKLTQDGCWERDIDEAEEFYTSLEKAYEGTGRVFFAITGVPGSVFDTTIPPLPPGYNMTRPSEGTRRSMRPLPTVHRSASGQMRPFRSCRRECPGWTGAMPTPPVPALSTLFLIRAPVTDDQVFRADLVLRAHHDIIDGMGTLLLLHNLFTLAADAHGQVSYELPQFGDEWSNLSPPLRRAAEIPAALSPEQEGDLREILEFNSALKRGVEIASPPFRRHIALPGKHQRVAITLPEGTTARLLAKCRTLGLSVTHAYHASIALAVGTLQECRETERTLRYVNYCLINERHHCKDPYSTPAHPASVYRSVSGRCLSIDLTVPALGSPSQTAMAEDIFLPVAEHVRDYYLEIRNNEEHIKLVPAYWGMSILPRPESEPPAIPSRNETPSASISSMGMLDKVIRHQYGIFNVDNPWVTGEELGTGLGFFLGTWKGRLTLSAAYNEAWHGKEEVLDALKRCNDIVFQGLGL
ncbi:hypothetical protein BDV11DRAFT_210932 [Aspergillus similis]